MPRPNNNPLTIEDRQRMLLLLKEAKARGIDVSSALQPLQQKRIKWPIASNGYFLRNDGYLYEPSQVHESFIKSTARNVLVFGPRGCGKSSMGSQKALFKIMQGESGIIMNPDFENLKISTWPEFKKWIPWDMVVVSQRHRRNDAWEPRQPFTMVFLNGAKVYIKGGKESGSSRGPNVNWFWYDEGGRDETGLAWHITNSGVRIGKDPQAWCTMTPRPTEHWAYKFFIKQEIPTDLKEEFEKLTGGGRILLEWFHATREDNKKHLDPSFYTNLALTYPSGWLRAQEFDGEFANEGGKIGDRSWFKDRILESPPERVIKKVRFWDLAATEKKKAKDDPDETVGSLISKFTNGKETDLCIEHQVGGFWDWDNLLIAIANTARFDGPYVTVVLEEEPGSGGKNQVAAIKSYFQKFPELMAVKVVGQRAREVGDRVMAANYWFSLAARGKMWLVKGNWNEQFLGQLDGFTQLVHDDRVTSITGGVNAISPFKSWSKTPFVSL